MNRNKALLLICALGLGLSAESTAGTITADGNLSDWGLFTTTTKTWIPDSNGTQTTKNGNTYYIAHGNYIYGDYKIYYAIEDYISGNGRVDPGYGGQQYDAEALYVTLDDTNLYIALVTGHNPNTKQNPSKNTYSAGDFALNFWSDTDDNTYDFGIRAPNQLNKGNPANIGSFLTNVYRTSNNDWYKDPLSWGTGAVTSLDMSKLQSEDLVGQANMTIQQGPDNIGLGPKSHWIYEISVAKSVFGDAFNNTDLNISWTMNCANDTITVKDDIPTIDEPPVWALLALTLPAVLWRQRHSSRC